MRDRQTDRQTDRDRQRERIRGSRELGVGGRDIVDHTEETRQIRSCLFSQRPSIVLKGIRNPAAFTEGQS